MTAVILNDLLNAIKEYNECNYFKTMKKLFSFKSGLYWTKFYRSYKRVKQ